jgi:tetratricopeptide (TPR) repeat protein
MKNSVETLLAIAVLILGFATVFVLRGHLEKISPELPEGYADQDLALQGARLKGYALGSEGLIADWYWMQSLQYVGNKIVKNRDAKISIDDLNSLNPRLLYPFIDNATTLDPRFTAAYSYGAVVLPAINKEQAIKVAIKGIENNPNEWRLYQQLGYIYWRLKDYEKAAEAYSKGSEIRDAPQFMKLMVASMKSDGGSRSTARTIYKQMFNEAEDFQTKETAELRLITLDSLDERDAIRAALKDFQQKTGKCVQSLQEILPQLRTIKLPDNLEFHLDNFNNIVDPSGAPYKLEKDRCDVNPDYMKSKVIPF